MASGRTNRCPYCGKRCYGRVCADHRSIEAQERNLAMYGTETRPNDKDVAAQIEEQWRFGDAR